MPDSLSFVLVRGNRYVLGKALNSTVHDAKYCAVRAGMWLLVVVYELHYHVHAMEKIDVSRKIRYMKARETERRAKRRCMHTAHIHVDRMEIFNTSVLANLYKHDSMEIRWNDWITWAHTGAIGTYAWFTCTVLQSIHAPACSRNVESNEQECRSKKKYSPLRTERKSRPSSFNFTCPFDWRTTKYIERTSNESFNGNRFLVQMSRLTFQRKLALEIRSLAPELHTGRTEYYERNGWIKFWSWFFILLFSNSGILCCVHQTCCGYFCLLCVGVCGSDLTLLFFPELNCVQQLERFDGVRTNSQKVMWNSHNPLRGSWTT